MAVCFGAETVGCCLFRPNSLLLCRERSSIFPFLDDDEASPTYAQTTQYLSHYFGDAQCSGGDHPVITIIQRVHRTIANGEELKQYLIDSHVSSCVTILILEHLTLQQQVNIRLAVGKFTIPD